MIFYRTHQSFLVNPKYVMVYMYDSMTLSDGSIISISIKQRKDVNRQYCSYIGDKIMDSIKDIIVTELFDIVLSAIILKIYFRTFFIEKEVKRI